MNEKLSEQSCASFAEALASAAPTPGGGGAAALTGAIAAALCSMVGNLTTGRKKYAAFESDIQRILGQAEALRLRLLSLADEDAAAFAPLAAAYSIPKDAPGRAETLESATLAACAAPMEMLRCVCTLVPLLEELLTKGSVLLVSDVGCGAACCRAAMEGAALNIFVNTKTLRCRESATRLNQEADALLAEFLPRIEVVAAEVSGRLRQEV